MARRCGVRELGVSMGKVFLGCLAAPLAVLLSTSALAESALGAACREYAAAVADDYMSDEMVRLDGTEEAGEGSYTVHAYGRKYLMPHRKAGEGAIVRKSIGTTTRQWGLVYTEERRRCLANRELRDLYAGN